MPLAKKQRHFLLLFVKKLIFKVETKGPTFELDICPIQTRPDVVGLVAQLARAHA